MQQRIPVLPKERGATEGSGEIYLRWVRSSVSDRPSDSSEPIRLCDAVAANCWKCERIAQL